MKKYIFLLLIIIFFINIVFKEKKFNFKYVIPVITFLIVIAPHLIWLIENDYTTIHYALFRSVDDPLSGFESSIFLDHILYPLIFLGKQTGVLLPFFLILFFIVSKFKTRLNYRNKKLLFLILITIVPIILMFLTSLFQRFPVVEYHIHFHN